MSIYYRDKNGSRRVVAGMTPGGDLAMGASTTRSGTISCEASSTQSYCQKTVTFTDPMPDGNYIIEIQPSSGAWEEEQWTCVNKSANGFTFVVHNINHTAPFVATTFYYNAFKLYEVSEAEQNASDITTIKSYIPASTTDSNKLVNASELADVDLEDLSDVDVTSIVDGQTLIWDDTNSKWVNGQGGKVYTEGLGIDIDANDKISVDQTYVPTTFTGTTAEWNALSSAEKAKYTLVSLTDDADYVGNIVDAVTNGEMSAVTSNAVYDALLGKLDSSKIKYGISSNAVDTTGSITFDTAFADTNYIVFICPINSNAGIAWSSSVISKTASGFVFETKYQTTNSTTWISYYRGIGWLAVHL